MFHYCNDQFTNNSSTQVLDNNKLQKKNSTKNIICIKIKLLSNNIQK